MVQAFIEGYFLLAFVYPPWSCNPGIFPPLLLRFLRRDDSLLRLQEPVFLRPSLHPFPTIFGIRSRYGGQCRVYSFCYTGRDARYYYQKHTEEDSNQ